MSDQAMTRAEVEEAISARLGGARPVTIRLQGKFFSRRQVADLFARLAVELNLPKAPE